MTLLEQLQHVTDLVVDAVATATNPHLSKLLQLWADLAPVQMLAALGHDTTARAMLEIIYAEYAQAD